MIKENRDGPLTEQSFWVWITIGMGRTACWNEGCPYHNLVIVLDIFSSLAKSSCLSRTTHACTLDRNQFNWIENRAGLLMRLTSHRIRLYRNDWIFEERMEATFTGNIVARTLKIAEFSSLGEVKGWHLAGVAMWRPRRSWPRDLLFFMYT